MSLEKIFKTYRAEIKAVNEKDHTVDVVVSTASIDRHLEIIEPEAFKKRLKEYKRHPILLSSHDYYSLTKQIGEAISIKVTDEGLVVKFKYYVDEGNDEANWGFKLAQKGIAAYSVGFIAHEFEDIELSSEEWQERKKARRIYKDVELIEISQVLIPSNRDAVQERRQHAEGEVKKIDARVKEPVVMNADVFAELCVKALEAQGLLEEKKTASLNPVKAQSPASYSITNATKDGFTVSISEEPKTGDPQTFSYTIIPDVDDVAQKTAIKTTLAELLKEARKDNAKEIVKTISEDAELREAFKGLILDVIQDMANEDFYKELLFGKTVKKDQKSTLDAKAVTEAVKELASTLSI